MESFRIEHPHRARRRDECSRIVFRQGLSRRISSSANTRQTEKDRRIRSERRGWSKITSAPICRAEDYNLIPGTPSVGPFIEQRLDLGEERGSACKMYVHRKWGGIHSHTQQSKKVKGTWDKKKIIRRCLGIILWMQWTRRGFRHQTWECERVDENLAKD